MHGCQRKWFLEMEPTPSECAVKMVEITTKNFGYFINLVDKVAASHATEKLFMKESVEAATFTVVLL